MKHPGGCVAYRISEGGRSLIFATDSELSTDDFRRSSENSAFFQDADVLILDSQYTLGEAIEKYDWGHTSYSMAVDFAAEWGIRTLVLFHHEPQYDDRKIQHHQLAKWLRQAAPGLQVRLAVEGLEVDV
jgi:ribonuclease BN (tRNA processing enzyme)